MALEDVTEVANTFDDYLKVAERDRDFIETSKLYDYGGSNKGANYNLKEFTRYNQETGVNETFYMTPVEYAKTFGHGPYLKDDPYEQIKDVKERIARMEKMIVGGAIGIVIALIANMAI